MTLLAVLGLLSTLFIYCQGPGGVWGIVFPAIPPRPAQNRQKATRCGCFQNFGVFFLGSALSK